VPATPAAVLFAADVTLVADFYCAVAGFRVVAREADHTVLAGNGFELVIHTGAKAPDGPVRTDAVVKLSLPVESIAAARTAAGGGGGRVLAPDGEWDGPGYRACDGVDPEGNVFQLREPR
jgi:predicted enzyme related to lactoylglutathione lyase